MPTAAAASEKENGIDGEGVPDEIVEPVETRLAVLAERINREHAACVQSLRRGLAHARTAGELLIEAKALVKYGKWLDWLQANFSDSERTAQRYMLIAAGWDELIGPDPSDPTNLSDLTYGRALRQLVAQEPEIILPPAKPDPPLKPRIGYVLSDDDDQGSPSPDDDAPAPRPPLQPALPLSQPPVDKTENVDTDVWDAASDWGTPMAVIKRVRATFGGTIDLDPCATREKRVPASRHFTLEDDGVTQRWEGRVFMNPPYSDTSRWVGKLVSEFAAGRVKEAIALVPSATSEGWWESLTSGAEAVCFWRGRLRFVGQGGQDSGPPNLHSAAVYLGPNYPMFLGAFRDRGRIWKPEP